MNSQGLNLLAEKLRANVLYRKYARLPALAQRLVLVSSLAFLTTVLLVVVYFFVDPIIAIGTFASILAGLATGFGALPALLFKNVSNRTLYLMLGGAAGVMLAATAFSLIVPGIDAGNELWPGFGVYVVAAGVLIGAVFLVLADNWLPYERFLGESGEAFASLRKIWLFIAAIVIHNLPEGMAVGVSFGSGDWHNGVVLAIAVGLQNVPEGLAVAMPLVALGYRRQQAVLIATLTGLIEPVGAVLGVAAVTMFMPLLPIGMAFAAGAMLFVISDDIIPETQSQGKARYATFALMFGFIIMMILDNLLTS
ncbi:ZIP zinc transporter family protein [Methylocaldum marinum]|uniref:ZIP zinc transporter family protein n=1 Tax=Methylocaldum marinum TaxID=1432792 RepID=A0A250KVG8_9GAMM|nr:ZIP family metal transporter [Methylocaldum marinum]BBA33779.1 ZIP zinc transporter family protein [Methylocaldum marinum]